MSEESGGGKILRRGCPLPCITLEHVVYYYMVIVIWLIVLVMRVRVPYKRYCEVCHNVLYCKYSV